jgi:hypothetical protein
LLLLGLLAVLAVGAVSAASASAQTCTGGSHFVFCTSPGNLPIENELVLGLGGLSVLAGTISGAAATFHCPDVHFHGELTTLGAGFGSLTFLHCVEEKPASCELEESTIVANFTSQQENATLATFTGSGTGNTFTTLKIKAKAGETCVAAGNFAVTGSQMVETPTGGEGKIEQEVQAKKAESNLKIGGNSASFSSKGEVHLGGANAGSAWLVMAGE